jgi:hypothetical protein
MKGPKPLSNDADSTIDNPAVVNDKPDMVITADKKPVPKKIDRPPLDDRPPPPVVSSPTNTASSLPDSHNSYSSSYSASSTAKSEDPLVALRRLEIERELALKESERLNEHWLRAYWRPAMGWLYMVICFMDFVGFPLLTIFLPIIFKPFGLTVPYEEWTSLTLSNGGLIHLSFGAILGVAAFTRGQEKIERLKTEYEEGIDDRQ